MMCRVLEVSRQGYYAWRKRSVSKRQREDAALLRRIRQLFGRSGGSYGSPRIWAQLRAEGHAVGRHRVARLMWQAGLRARRKQGYKRKGKGTAANAPAENLLRQDFGASKPNRKWLADITYIAAGQNQLKLALVMDVYSRKVVGWSMSQRATSQLVKDALNMALQRREVSQGLILHSDRGSQYTEAGYRQLLRDRGIRQSMSGVGNCYDNAMMESFIATLKTECACSRFATLKEARAAVFRYIEGWYNRRRLHSGLEYVSPLQFEQAAGYDKKDVN
ncbi:MAG: IS3 family transposase [Chloroflexi bacterium]|nr:IS3 family transposase [Chloroflexota bacterium]